MTGTEKAELISTILTEYQNAGAKSCREDTFLSVIGKNRDENYISRLIAYALEKMKI